MKNIFSILFFIGLANQVQSQEVKGTVIDSNSNETIIGASVQLLNSDKETSTDSNGNFNLEGQGTIEISAAGYKTVRLKSSADLMTIRLEIDRNELQTVEIVGRSTRKYNSDYSFAATKTAALNKDIPQSISSITKELIADKGAFYLADAVKMSSV